MGAQIWLLEGMNLVFGGHESGFWGTWDVWGAVRGEMLQGEVRFGAGGVRVWGWEV